MSEHKQALEYLRKYKGFYYSPYAVKNMCGLSMLESTLARKFRLDRQLGLLKSRKEQMETGQYFMTYAHKRTKVKK